jgi:hypothetical protein
MRNKIEIKLKLKFKNRRRILNCELCHFQEDEDEETDDEDEDYDDDDEDDEAEDEEDEAEDEEAVSSAMDGKLDFDVFTQAEWELIS